MLRSWLTLPIRWVGARLGLFLAGIYDEELQRLRTRRTQWITLLAGFAALLVVLAGSVASSLAPKGASPLRYWYLYLIGVPPLLAALGIFWYSTVAHRRALRDRTTNPVARKTTVRRLLSARDGGWPLLLRDQDGRGIWLTGSREVLGPVRTRLARHRFGRPFQLTITLAYYPRCRVIQEVRGMAVEELSVALEPSESWAAART
jgi:hypothetical protein